MLPCTRRGFCWSPGTASTVRYGRRCGRPRGFFALPTEVKERYAVRIGGRGRPAPGVESNANADRSGDVDGLAEDAAGADNPPDLKESFAIGPDTPTDDAAVDAVWFPPDVWPSDVPEPHAEASRYRVPRHERFGTQLGGPAARGRRCRLVRVHPVRGPGGALPARR